jgi:hypothetical protein
MSRNAMNECIDAVNEREDQRDTERMERAMYEQPKGPTMTKHTINGFVTWQKYEWEDKPTIGFYDFDPGPPTDPHSRVVVCAHSFEVGVPDNFDPREKQVAGLVAEKQKARAEFAARITELDAQINKLLCLEMAATE